MPSYDRVEVPLSIVYPKGMKLDGGNPVHLYGYGAYGITDDPVYGAAPAGLVRAGRRARDLPRARRRRLRRGVAPGRQAGHQASNTWKG